jgi:GH24 family phage-related lysozyme (muramidase)
MSNIDEIWKDSPFMEGSIFHPSHDERKKMKVFDTPSKIKEIIISKKAPWYNNDGYRNPQVYISLEVKVFTEGIDISGVNVNLNGGILLSQTKSTKNHYESKYFVVVFDFKYLPFLNQFYTFTIQATLYDKVNNVVDVKSEDIKVNMYGAIIVDGAKIRKNITELKPSSNLLSFLKEIEKLEKVVTDGEGNITKIIPYNSFEGGTQTIGWGHKIKKGDDYNSGITLLQAEQLLLDDVQSEGVNKLLRFKGDKLITVPLLQHEFDAIVSFVFNGVWGVTIVKAINEGAESYLANPEKTYKAFLEYRYSGGVETDGLIKRRAREAEIFLYNKWHSYGAADEKFKTKIEFIKEFKNFIKTGILPLFVLFLFIGCGQLKSPPKEISSGHNRDSFLFHNSKYLSDSLKAALGRIHFTRDGVGSNSDVKDSYGIERESWLKEIELIRLKLTKKISEEHAYIYDDFVSFNSGNDIYLESHRKFATNYIEEHFRSGESIFHIMTYYRKEYFNMLQNYYYLYEIDQETK